MAQDHALEEKQATTQTTTKLCFKESSLDPKEHVEEFKLKCLLTTNRDLVGKKKEYQFTKQKTLLGNNHLENY